MDERTIEFYDRDARAIAERYESVESPFASLFPIVFTSGTRILDIGCGSGRDMALLMKHGFDPYGLEPSTSLRDCAFKRHPELKGRIVQGAIPRNVPENIHDSFDGVILSAMLMHIPDSELFDAAIEIRRRLKTGGTLLLSIPEERNDMSDDPDRDDKGRLMLLRPAAKVQLLFERIGFSAAATWHSQDKFNRKDIGWVTL